MKKLKDNYWYSFIDFSAMGDQDNYAGCKEQLINIDESTIDGLEVDIYVLDLLEWQVSAVDLLIFLEQLPTQAVSQLIANNRVLLSG